MIIAVDDENFTLEIISRSLEAEGFSVKTFTDATEALVFAAGQEPEMIISDISMPIMGGFEFKAAYSRQFPQRLTPFVFLSSHADPETVVKGINTGADDYLVKPVHPDVLRAKTRAILRRKEKYSAQAFHGDLSRFPLVKILQFCELKGLTGTVEIPQDGGVARLLFRGGNIDLDDPGVAATFDRLYDLTVGTFTIRPQPVDFGEIAEAAIVEVPAASPNESTKPMGRLSGIKVNQRLFQIQTEFVTYPENMVMTVVILDGKVVTKRNGPVPPSADRTSIERLIEEQHLKVEAEVNEKVAAKNRTREETEETPREKVGRLFEAGFDKYRAGQLKEALELWEEAHALDPQDKTLEINLSIVRKKLKI